MSAKQGEGAPHSRTGRMEIRGVKITKTDYGGLVAIILTVGFVVLLTIGRTSEAAVLGPFAGWFLRDYFGLR